MYWEDGVSGMGAKKDSSHVNCQPGDRPAGAAWRLLAGRLFLADRLRGAGGGRYSWRLNRARKCRYVHPDGQNQDDLTMHYARHFLFSPALRAGHSLSKICLTVLCASLAWDSALAQEAMLPTMEVTASAESSGLGLAESAVTGSRTGIRVQELPASVEKLDA